MPRPFPSPGLKRVLSGAEGSEGLPSSVRARSGAPRCGILGKRNKSRRSVSVWGAARRLCGPFAAQGDEVLALSDIRAAVPLA